MKPKIRAAVLAALLSTACADGVGPDFEQNVATVTVIPGDASITVGATQALSATVYAADGSVLAGRAVTWESDDDAIAQVSSTGVVTARSSGLARIKASSGGKAGTAQIQVLTQTVEDVVLDRDAATLEEGVELQITATPRDAAGNPIAGLGAQWTSSAPEIATVGALGKVTAIRPGTAVVTARVHGEEASAAITVSASYDYDLIYTMASADAHALHEIFRLDVRQQNAAPGRLFAASEWAAQPSPSPDGSRIAFVCPSDFGDPGICTANQDGSGRAVIAWHIGESFTDPTWSPDGTRLAFTRTRYEAGGTIRSRIWVVGTDGANAVELTAGMDGNQATPAWSPVLADGKQRIAFASGSASQQRIWSMAPDGTAKLQVTAAADALDMAPAWSPDGGTIAFQRISPTVAADLWVVSVADGEARPLTGALAGVQAAPVWSPDGRMVAFVSSHETYASGALSYQVYTVWADGSKLARRTFDAGDKSLPAWLPRQ